MISTGIYKQIEKDNWIGFDPFDGLASPYFAPFIDSQTKESASLTKWIKLAILQLVKRSPVNFRRILGIPPLENAMLHACLILGLVVTQQDISDAFRFHVKQLLKLRSQTNKLWGYPFPWQSLAFYLPPNAPNLVISAVCLRALADAYVLSGWTAQELSELKSSYLSSLERFVELFYFPENNFFSYVAHKPVLVHNANLFAVEAISFALREFPNDIPHHWSNAAQTALLTTLSTQSKDGRWSYGTEIHHQWCDNFHTAYNLTSLNRILSHSNFPLLHEQLMECLQKGLNYYLRHAFTFEADAKYFDESLYPIEGHSYAAAFVLFSELKEHSRTFGHDFSVLQQTLIDSLVKRLQLPNGSFGYRAWKHYRISTVFNRWTHAWLFYGLARGRF